MADARTCPRSIYSKRLSRGQNYADADQDTYWSDLENTTELSVCGGDAVVCQITLTTCLLLLLSLFNVIIRNKDIRLYSARNFKGRLREMLWCCTVFLGDLDCARQSSTRRKLISCDHHFYANDSSIDKCQ